MSVKRRDFLQLSAIVAGTGILTGFSSFTAREEKKILRDMQSMADDVVPISTEERKARIKKAQRLMVDQKIEALVLDAGTSMEYFTGISWGQSERPMVVVIPAKSEPRYICPGFEESRLRERIAIGKNVNAWQEGLQPIDWKLN